MGIQLPFLLVMLVSVLVTSRANDNSTTTNVTFPLPSHCPTSCGDIFFEYPFGVGHGCFRPGFELTCMNTTTNPPKLLLGNSSSVIEVNNVIVESFQDIIYASSYASLYVNAPFAMMGANDSYSYTSWTAPANAPYYFSGTNDLLVVGCSAVASLVDPISNQTLAKCTTQEGPDFYGYNVNATCGCWITTERELQSYGIRLSRTYQNTDVEASIVKAFMASSDQNSGELPRASLLYWHINDQHSCEEAEKETNYGCLGQDSVCVTDGNSIIAGYWCRCPELMYIGNPYLPDGCDDHRQIRVAPSEKCATKCGNLNITFPFGLGEGCYIHESFNLTCNETLDPPLLIFYGGVVDNVMVDEGKIEISSVGNFETPSSWFGMIDSGSFAFLHDRAVFNWAIEFRSCAEAKQNVTNFACRSKNSTCVDTKNVTIMDRTGYRCKCLDGFEGNPYVSDGCKDIDECKSPELYVCYGDCRNTIGSYSCSCPSGTQGDPTQGPCHKKEAPLLGIIVGVCVGFGTILLAIASYFSIGKWKKLSEKRTRKRYFHKNKGLLLQQLIASDEGNAEKIKIFSLEDLEKATDNFDTSRILGQGGHGIVYKGILSNLRVVAIKRSKIFLTREIDEFINEVIILSQINHRNIVKLFGCCLELEVPILVYEFISNRTLFYHLHDPDHKSTLSWRDRLRIATEVAGALAYMHSSASISIFHRDMKSSNILLDEYNTSKVSDFGASKFIRLDQTHIFTAIKGTFGYLDPEYYQTWKLTAKSDVYSFGVILLELLTGQNPISFAQTEEGGNLVMRFLQSLRENQQFELMEARLLEEGTKEELVEVAELAKMCLKLKGNERPSMTEVESQLSTLRRTKDISNGYV